MLVTEAAVARALPAVVSLLRSDQYEKLPQYLRTRLERSAHQSHRQDKLWEDFDSRVHADGYASVLVPPSELGSNPRASILTTMLHARSLIIKDLRFHPAALSNPMDKAYPCIWVNGHEMPHGWSLDAISVDDMVVIEIYGLNTPQDRSLKNRRGDVRPVSGQPPCGQFRANASPTDELPQPRRDAQAQTAHNIAPPIREVNPRLMIGSVVVWLKN